MCCRDVLYTHFSSCAGGANATAALYVSERGCAATFLAHLAVATGSAIARRQHDLLLILFVLEQASCGECPKRSLRRSRTNEKGLNPFEFSPWQCWRSGRDLNSRPPT